MGSSKKEELKGGYFRIIHHFNLMFPHTIKHAFKK